MTSNLLKPVGAIPLGDRIIVRRLEERTITRGGIHLADAAKEKPQFGVVLSAGEDVRNPYLAKGKVLITFGKYTGTEIEIDGEPLLTMREEEVTAIITNHALIDELVKWGA